MNSLSIAAQLLTAIPLYACIDHGVGGARLFRGEENAKASELHSISGGAQGYRTWYWDTRALYFTAFGLLTYTYASINLGFTWWGLGMTAALTGVYTWLRGRSPRKMFPAGKDVSWAERKQAIIDGAKLGVIGLAPGILGAFNNPWLIFTPLLGLGFGLYHAAFHKDPLFRSKAELCQGATVAIFVLLQIWGAV